MSSPLSAARIGWVRLNVRDIDRSLRFYYERIGLRVAHRDETGIHLSASGDPPAQVVLSHADQDLEEPSSGLFHFALRVPRRKDLAQTLRRMIREGVPFPGFADHGVSEALYLADPEGNGIEIYCDRPADQWPRYGGRLAMVTEPLDLEDLMQEVDEEAEDAVADLHPETDVGHIHLCVSDLTRARAFYSDVIGMEITQDTYPGALFMAAGGYHHHVGANVWNSRGLPPRKERTPGLEAFELIVPDQRSVEAISGRLEMTGYAFHSSDEGHLVIRDPDGVEVCIGN